MGNIRALLFLWPDTMGGCVYIRALYVYAAGPGWRVCDSCRQAGHSFLGNLVYSLLYCLRLKPLCYRCLSGILSTFSLEHTFYGLLAI